MQGFHIILCASAKPGHLSQNGNVVKLKEYKKSRQGCYIGSKSTCFHIVSRTGCDLGHHASFYRYLFPNGKNQMQNFQIIL
jgi:hypothetical protein